MGVARVGPAIVASATKKSPTQGLPSKNHSRRRSKAYIKSNMTATRNDTWHQMLLVSPEGREEVLWVAQVGQNTFRVLSVPVWIYGLSVGSVVEASHQAQSGSPLKFGRLLRESPGGTVRFIVPTGVRASDIYLSRVIPDAKRLGLYIGPATFYNPRLVAVHVHDRRKWWPEVGGYLDGLVQEGVLEQWEVGDPDQYAADHEESTLEKVEPGSSVLVHPLPVDGADGECVS